MLHVLCLKVGKLDPRLEVGLDPRWLLDAVLEIGGKMAGFNGPLGALAGLWEGNR